MDFQEVGIRFRFQLHMLVIGGLIAQTASLSFQLDNRSTNCGMLRLRAIYK